MTFAALGSSGTRPNGVDRNKKIPVAATPHIMVSLAARDKKIDGSNFRLREQRQYPAIISLGKNTSKAQQNSSV